MTDHDHDHGNFPGIDPAFIRGLTQSRMSRRDLLRSAGVGAGALSLGAILAACGVKGTTNAQKNTDIGTTAWWDQQAKTTELIFANWPYYIDIKNGEHPSIQKFTADTGINVSYKTPINGNDSFYAKIAPLLKNSQATGYDIVVLTTNSPVLDKMIHTNGWAIPLDQRQMTNFKANASPLVSNPEWDPGNKYTMAWQSGLTAIGYNPKLTGREITSVLDLFDPAFSGHVGMMSDLEEIGTVGLLAIGVDPTTSTPDDWQKAADKLKTQTPLVRQYYDQGYIDDLESGDIWISMAWSGDVFQANKAGFTDLKMAVPTEGGMLWTDNMMIPLYAQNPQAAMKFMDAVYAPDIAGTIADYVTYITPCAACQDYIKTTLNDPKAAESQLIFPSAETASRFKQYYKYKDESEVTAWNDIFEPIVTQ